MDLLPALDELAQRAARYSILLNGTVDRDVTKCVCGGFAVVYQGILRPVGTKVAIKSFRFGDKRDIAAIKNMLYEIHLWSKLHHQNVVPLLGITTDFDQTISTVSEWMAGGNAHDYVQDRSIDPRPLLSGIAEGLYYLHTHEKYPICHGDLKGRNVLISDDGRALLTDFGLSHTVQSSFSMTTPSRQGGSLNWMPPEFLDGETESGPTIAGDIWSFGMTALELFTCQEPFSSVSSVPSRVMLRILNGPPDRPTIESTCFRMNNEWWNMCSECWHKNPSLRPDMLRILRDIHHLGDSGKSLWRDYYPGCIFWMPHQGTSMPPDAIPGGEEKGQPTYICRALVPVNNVVCAVVFLGNSL
ncbi:hypothetical protein ID866_10051 [Astraeus odoratus]|nr:hypothetical protein ID866_10051 [Astraeus odoratus]